MTGNPEIPSATWINCLGSEINFRGYPCGAWTLFHVLQMSAYEQKSEESQLDQLKCSELVNFELKNWQDIKNNLRTKFRTL